MFDNLDDINSFFQATTPKTVGSHAVLDQWKAWFPVLSSEDKQSDEAIQYGNKLYSQFEELNDDLQAEVLAAGKPTLRYKSSGINVEELQTLLNVSVDGKFGPQTETAVKTFQKANGLVDDGIVGRLTWTALLQKKPVAIPKPPTPKVKPVTTTHPTIRQGSSGSAVTELQNFLQITADGKFGSQTKSAVEAFQLENDLTVDGVVGPNTWAVIEAKTVPTTASGKAEKAAEVAKDTVKKTAQAAVEKVKSNPPWKNVLVGVGMFFVAMGAMAFTGGKKR